MKNLYFVFAIVSIFIGTACAQQPAMTIYGTPQKDDNKADGSLSRKARFDIDSAESSINIYGTIDVGVRNVTNTTTTGGNTLSMGSNGQFYNNRIGFKGQEDLGGGVNAHFHLEAGFNSGTGALDNDDNRLFNRISSVGIAGTFGSIDLGRQPSISCKTIYSYDPFRYRYVQIIPLAGACAGNADGNTTGYPFGTMGGTRFDNDIQYLGKFGDFIVSAEYAMGEVGGSISNGAAKAGGLIYTIGPFTIAGAYTMQKPNIAVSGGVADYQDQNQLTFGGAYKSDAFRVAGGYIETTTNTDIVSITNQAKNIWIGTSYDFTPVVSLTAGYYRTTLATANSEVAARNLFITGAIYTLSARTNLYADIDQASLSGIASLTVGKKTQQTGISVGINHMF